MSFKIIITQTKEVPSKGGHEWRVVGERTANKEDLEKMFIPPGARDQLATQKFADYGYTPEYDTTQTVNLEIFSQVVEELDLGRVISAINNL